MSFRDLRLLTENLRVLGYPRTVSLDAFREPNFKLVAELLIWLTSIYEPHAVIPSSVESEHDRIALIKGVAQLFVTKQHIKLNAKKLYQADGYAVKELLKLINSLVETTLNAKTDHNDQTNKLLEPNLKQAGLRDMRERVMQITRAGATLHEALGADIRCRVDRHLAASNQLELGEIERALKDGIRAAEKVTKQSIERLSSAGDDEKTIETKIEKKEKELERNQKRLRQLKQLRPAYQDELEELETDLKLLYEDYCVKFRNATYLENLLEQYRKEVPDSKQQFLSQEQFNQGQATLKMSTHDLTSDEDDSILEDHHHHRGLFGGPGGISDDDELTDEDSEEDDEDDDGLVSNEDDDF